ncbi:MAG: diphosphate--fructose-6-phosphate 1-phosphotransferase [Bacilli bacterium]|nr:diphosphate--fructose-6-phosphate 1-phosphotransferase [Bacilli bacterium]
MKNMVYIQSGGPTSVINTSFYGAVMEAKKHPDLIDNIYGSLNGIEGMIDDKLIDINQEDNEQLELLLQTPGSILGTTRRKLPKDIHDPVYMSIINTIKKHEIKYVFVNGGNDSMDTCFKLSLLCKELNLDVQVIGVPKTIDNDLACTDHSLGFPSAAKFVVNTINALSMDAKCFKVGKVHIVEIMGRNAGWLTAAADVLPEETRPHLIYLPENKFDLEEFLKEVQVVYEAKGYAMVAISEGLSFERPNKNARVDGFGHAQLGGTAAALCEVVEERLDLPTRPVEFSLTQRACPLCISKVDQDEALQTGKIAVESALKGVTGKMVIFKRISQKPYQIDYQLADLSLVANAESVVKPSMMIDHTKMSQEFKDYIMPLLEGEPKIKFVNGVAPMAKFKKVLVK